MLVSPVLDQTHWRFRDDDGTETTATWRQAVDTDDTQATNTKYRVRFSVAETAGGGAPNKTFQLEYQRNGGGWNDVTETSSVVNSVLTGNYSDGDDSTQQISAGTFVSPNQGMDEAGGTGGIAGGNNNNFSGNDVGEYEYCYQIRSADVNDADTIDLRIQGLDAYSVADATITVSKPGAARRVFVI